MWNRTVLWLCHRGSCHIIVLLFITCKTCNSILVFVTVGGAVILHTVKAQHIQLTVNVYVYLCIYLLWFVTYESLQSLPARQKQDAQEKHKGPLMQWKKISGFKRSLKNCRRTKRQSPQRSAQRECVCLLVRVCVCVCEWPQSMFLSLYVTLLNVCTVSYKKKMLRLSRFLSGVLYWFRGLTARTVPVWRVNRLWQASCTTAHPIRG